jgi:hypothetical protein
MTFEGMARRRLRELGLLVAQAQKVQAPVDGKLAEFVSLYNALEAKENATREEKQAYWRWQFAKTRGRSSTEQYNALIVQHQNAVEARKKAKDALVRLMEDLGLVSEAQRERSEREPVAAAAPPPGSS